MSVLSGLGADSGGRFAGNDRVTLPGASASQTLADSVPLTAKSFNAKGDGLTDDQAALDAAWAAVGANQPVQLPAGDYVYGTNQFAGILGPKRFVGPGRILHGGNKIPPFFSAISGRPALGNYSGPDTAFNGDISKVQIAMDHRITGSATLGQPTSGYLFTPEASATWQYVYNSSGFNNSVSTNGAGRTGAVANTINLAQAGQGDLIGTFWSGVVTSVKAGATHWLANPAISAFAIDLRSTVPGAYLNPIELSLSDGGNDISSIGPVVNMIRTAASAALETYWAGFRAQSKGTVAVDDAFIATGKYDRGLAFHYADLGAAGAAIAMKSGHRVYGKASGTDIKSFKNVTLGDAYFGYDAAKLGWDFVAGGASLLTIAEGSKLGFFGATAVAKPTGVAVTAAGVHAALVSLGLIAA